MSAGEWVVIALLAVVACGLFAWIGYLFGRGR